MKRLIASLAAAGTVTAILGAAGGLAAFATSPALADPAPATTTSAGTPSPPVTTATSAPVFTSPATPPPTSPITSPPTPPASSPAAVAPVITLQPHDIYAWAGRTVSFPSAASGSPKPTVQWEQSPNYGGHWSDVPGATSPTLVVPTDEATDGMEYRAVYTNVAGTATTKSAYLSVLFDCVGGGGTVAIPIDTARRVRGDGTNPPEPVQGVGPVVVTGGSGDGEEEYACSSASGSATPTPTVYHKAVSPGVRVLPERATLPVTGAPLGNEAGIAELLLMAGGGLLWAARKRI